MTCASNGITTMWHPNKVMSREVSCNPHFVSMELDDKVYRSFLFIFYAPNTRVGRLVVWKEATRAIRSLPITSINCAREFNNPLHLSGKLRGFENYCDNMYDLADFPRHNDVLDIDLQGSPYT